MKRVFLIAAAALVLAAPAQALSKQSGTWTTLDGVSLAYDLYEPDGAPPAGGWPAVVVLHGLGGSKDDMGQVATFFASHGYAALAYSARGQGTSTGSLELAGPNEVADERTVFTNLTALPEVSDSKVAAWGISYGGGQVWNGIAAGIPYAAADVVETWTDLYGALWPGDVAKSGVVLGFAKSVEARSPLLRSNESDAVHSTNLAQIRTLLAPRSAYPSVLSKSVPVYMFQGRVDYAFDVEQALQVYRRYAGAARLYVGDFGHTPSTFPGPDVDYVLGQGLAWFDHFLRGAPNGIEQRQVQIAPATWNGKPVAYAPSPRTTPIPVGFRGTALTRTGPRFGKALETFGVSTLKVQVTSLTHYPRLVAVVSAGNRTITHGAVVPHKGQNTIRLASYVQYLPKGTRLTVRFGPDSGAGDVAYLGFGDEGSIRLGAAFLNLQTLTRRASR